MCIAIVKHCPCVKCMEEPFPESTERLNYCADKQEIIRGIWGGASMPIFTRQKLMMPCHLLTHTRVLDANVCMHRLGNASQANATAAVTDERPLIKFTPINVPSKGPSKLASSALSETSGVAETTLAETGSDRGLDVSYLASAAQQALEFSAEKQASDKTPAKDNDRDNANANKIDDEIDNDNVSTTTEEADHPAADEMDIDKPVITSVTTTGTSTNPITVPETPHHPHKRARLNPPSTTATKPTGGLTTAATLSQLAKNLTSSSTVGSSVSGSSLSSKPPTPTPSTAHRSATKGRTPLPTSRPLTPRVIQATAAAAAAELAVRVARGVWTHEESCKVLLLRCREVEFGSARAREVLPGRDAAACEDQLADLALKYGYEDHI